MRREIIVLLALLATLASCSLITNSSCNYNHASFVPGDLYHWTTYRENVCQSKTTQEECESKGYCWWRNTTNQNSLAAHLLEQVPPRIYNPAQGIYVAVGFDLANSILVINNNQSVLIDTLGSLGAAKNAIAAFTKFLGHPIPPIVAVIYTHSHVDHISGTGAWNLTAGTPIYAHAAFLESLQKVALSLPILRTRAVRQFALELQQLHYNADGFLGSGIGPFTTVLEANVPTVLPNRFFSTSLNVTLAGIDFQLYFTPGETDDTIAVHIPSLSVTCVGDNVYKAFSNLYAIRGTPPRDARKWYKSVDQVRALNPSVIIGSHTAPITENVAHILTVYRDAIAYVHDQTVLLFNQGAHPDDIAATVKLPDYLASEPYLQQFYGFIPWCVKSIFISYLGWFSGDLAELEIATTTAQAQRLVKLAGGADLAIFQAAEALNEGTLEGAQWALTLATAVNRTLARDAPELPYVYEIYIQAAAEIGYAQVSTNGRNYYLQTAAQAYASLPQSPESGKDLDQLVNGQMIDEDKMELLQSPLVVFMEVLAGQLNYEKSRDILINARIRVKDEHEDGEYVVVIRREVLEAYPSSFPLTRLYETSLDVTFSSALSFKSLILSLTDVQTEIDSANLQSDSPVAEISFFFDLFRK